MTALFERIVMVDWSAASRPVTGRDSIWIAMADADGARTAPVNHATRSSAMQALRDAVAHCHNVLIGMDFAFGYPASTAASFGGRWEGVWGWLAQAVTDRDDNRNDRFDVAERFNARFPDGTGPLWGHPRMQTREGLSPTKPRRFPPGLCERRAVERIVRNTQPTGKLAYPGSVGSQTLLGIARLEAWRRDPELGPRTKIWPFETRFADAMDAEIVFTEIFPSLHPIEVEAGEVRDAAQVRTLAREYSGLDRTGRLRPHLAGPTNETMRSAAIDEEGWIMSVADAPIALAA